jgi:hypothetical protein
VVKDQPLAPSGDGESNVRIRRGRVESVDLYEIKDSELEILERGSPADLQLNFAIFLLSLAFTGICTLATAIFEKPKIELTFFVVTVCSTLIGIYLLISWFRNRTSLKVLCKRIRQRIPPDSGVVVLADVNVQETTFISNKPQG